MVVGDLKVPLFHLVLKEQSQAAGHSAKPAQAGTVPAATPPAGGSSHGGLEDKEQVRIFVSFNSNSKPCCRASFTLFFFL